MDIDPMYIIPVIYPSILIMWMGSLSLRKKTSIVPMRAFLGLFMTMFIWVYGFQILHSYIRHVDRVNNWSYGTPPEFNWMLQIVPIIILIPLFLLFMIIFRRGFMLYNIKDEDFSKCLDEALTELDWVYHKDFTFIHVKEPKLKIKVGMMDQMRSCQVYFKDFKDSATIKRFEEVFKSKVASVETKPFLPMGLLFLFMGFFFPSMLIVTMAMI